MRACGKPYGECPNIVGNPREGYSCRIGCGEQCEHPDGVGVQACARCGGKGWLGDAWENEPCPECSDGVGVVEGETFPPGGVDVRR